MSEKISETLKRLAAATSRGSSPTSSSTERSGAASPAPGPDLLGDPNCPFCHGLGYLRRDLPLGHPDFGKLELCSCRQADVRARIRDRLFSLSHLEELGHLTFESFNVKGRVNMPEFNQASIERAYNVCLAYAHKLDGWVLLQGGFGTGKTHLAAAIANECVLLGVPTLFLTVPDLLDSLRAGFGDEELDFDRRFEQVKGAALLILDDLGTQNATEWAREKLFQILNHRYVNRLPTVVTTNLALAEIDGRIRSRLLDPDLVKSIIINAPDYRQSAVEIAHHDLSSLALHHDQTFGTFSLRDGERMAPDHKASIHAAFEAARKYSENPDGWLVLLGPYLCGKTHLAAAIANFRASLGYPPLFVAVPDLLDHLRATFGPNSTVTYDRLFEEVRSTPLLILDDLGSQASTPWAQEKLFQLMNHRYNAGLATVITTAEYLDKIDARLSSRMLDTRICTIHAITAPPFRGAKSRRRSKR